MSDDKDFEKKIEDFINVISNNVKPILIGLGVVVAVGLGVVGYNYQKKASEKTAYGEFYALEKQFDNIQKEMRKDLKPDQDIEYTEDVFNKNFASTASSAESFIDSNKDKAAAIMAAMELAQLYTSFEMNEKAKATLGKLIDNVNAETLTGALYHVEYGRVLVETGSYGEAQDVLNKVVNSKQVTFLHPVALLNLGLSYYKDNKLDQAKELFTRISKEFSESEPGRAAGVYLKLLNSTKG